MEREEELEQLHLDLDVANATFQMHIFLIAVAFGCAFLFFVFDQIIPAAISFISFLIMIVLTIRYDRHVILGNEIEQIQFEAHEKSLLAEEKREAFDPVEVAQYLSDSPDYSRDQLLLEFYPIKPDALEDIAMSVFEDLLELRSYDKAEILAKFHAVDPFNRVHVARKLNDKHMTGKLTLEPHIFKIILNEGETAFEKLPCNWQKIHTYLAPHKDGLDQADILDSGHVYLTDQRVLFVGRKGSETVRLADLTFIDLKEDALQFFRDEGLSEIFAFPTAHHATYAKIVVDTLIEQF